MSDLKTYTPNRTKKKELEKECSSYHVRIHIPEHRKTPGELTITQ
jgi:hypothetical protein